MKLCQSGEMTGMDHNIEGLADTAILGWWFVGWVLVDELKLLKNVNIFYNFHFSLFQY